MDNGYWTPQAAIGRLRLWEALKGYGLWAIGDETMGLFLYYTRIGLKKNN